MKARSSKCGCRWGKTPPAAAIRRNHHDCQQNLPCLFQPNRDYPADGPGYSGGASHAGGGIRLTLGIPPIPTFLPEDFVILGRPSVQWAGTQTGPGTVCRPPRPGDALQQNSGCFGPPLNHKITSDISLTPRAQKSQGHALAAKLIQKMRGKRIVSRSILFYTRGIIRFSKSFSVF